MLNRYLQKTEDGEVTLTCKSGYISCPFASPIIQQSNLGSPPTVVPKPCDSYCPHFHFNENKTNSITLTCGGTPVNLVIQEVKPVPNPLTIVH